MKILSSFYYKILSSFARGSFRNFLSINSLLKLAFLYFVTVLYIILFTFDFSSNAFSKDAKRKIAIYAVEGRIGEYEAYKKTLIAIKNLGWDYVGSAFEEHISSYIITKHFYVVAANLVNFIVKPEVNITLTHYVPIIPRGYNLIYLNVPDVMLYTARMKFMEDYPTLPNYDGYIDLYSVYHEENNTLKQVLANHKKEEAPIIPAYLAQNKQEFIAPPSYSKAVVTGSLWGCNRGSLRMSIALKSLADEKLLVAYGLKGSFEYLGDAYLGRVPKYDSPGDETLIELQRKHGIALVMHSFEHFVAGIPTSRFAEAIISGSIMISDNHPFIRKFLGDNVLYFDSMQSGEKIAEQIKNHIIWIKSHPEEVKLMTKNAYDIFVRDWTLEVQMQNLVAEVLRIKQEKKLTHNEAI